MSSTCPDWFGVAESLALASGVRLYCEDLVGKWCVPDREFLNLQLRDFVDWLYRRIESAEGIGFCYNSGFDRIVRIPRSSVDGRFAHMSTILETYLPGRFQFSEDGEYMTLVDWNRENPRNCTHPMGMTEDDMYDIEMKKQEPDRQRYNLLISSRGTPAMNE